MRTRLPKLVAWAGFAAVIALLLASAATSLKRRQEVDPVLDQQKIARTLQIIRTSTPTHHKVLKVLFYGQSITRSGWHNAVVAHWLKKYPNVKFVVENRALGGFASQVLVRTTEQDIAAFYPDLIIFHVYGDHRAYEKILRMFRSLTAADVILQTDHGEVLPDPVCAEGLQLSPRGKPGCAGVLWVNQRFWHDEMSYHKIPAFAKKYGMAVEPQRVWWRDYLLQHQIDPGSLLMDDGLHPNQQGNELIAGLFSRYFDNLVEHWDGQSGPQVVSIADPGKHVDGTETFDFDGSRLEMLADRPLAVWPSVTIDGRAPGDMDGCYQVTRASPLKSVADWPSLRRITLLHDHTAEDWTATITKITPDQKTVDFTVRASVAGDEGSSNSSRPYVSKSGNLSIDGDDWMFKWGYDLKHISLEVPAEVHWSVKYICGANADAVDRGDGSTEYRYVLGAGLANRRHTARIAFPANEPTDAIEYRAYKPPLQDD